MAKGSSRSSHINRNKNTLLAQYFPYHFEQTRSYLPEVIREYHLIGDKPPGYCEPYELVSLNAPIHEAIAQLAEKTRSESDHARLLRIAVEKMREYDDHPLGYAVNQVVVYERKLAANYCAYRAHGRRLYTFTPELLEWFKQTDCSNVLLADVNLPFPALYLHFGIQEDIPIAGPVSRSTSALVGIEKMSGMESELTKLFDQVLEEISKTETDKDTAFAKAILQLIEGEGRGTYFLCGAFVSRVKDGGLDIILIGQKPDQQFKSNWIDYSHEVSASRIPLRWEDITVKEALELEQKEIAEEYQTGSKREHLVEELSKNLTVQFYDALPLIVNSILYITNYFDIDVDCDYPDAAPAQLIEKAEKSAKARKELKELGFQKIYKCGIKGTVVIPSLNKGTHASPITHERQGHYRTYQRGTKRQFKRWIWDTVVNEGKTDTLDITRIYAIKEKRQMRSADIRITIEMEQEIKEMATAGIAIEEIADYLGLPTEAINKLLADSEQ